MNSAPESAPPPDLEHVLVPREVGPSGQLASAFAELEKENAALRDAIKEERFCWILLSIVLFDIAVFASVQTTGVPLAILALQLVLLVVVAKRLGVEQVIRLVDRCIDGWARRNGD